MKPLEIEYLVDAGPLVAIFNADDNMHAWSVGALEILGHPLFTTEMVVAEVCYFLRKHLGKKSLAEFWGLIESGRMQICATLPDATTRIKALMDKYGQMDVADASLIVLSERNPRARLITIDRRDFTVYRRNDGNPVPCIMPAQ